MQEVIDVLEAERDELRSGLFGLRSRSSSSAASTTERPRALRRPDVAGRATAQRGAAPCCRGVSLQGDSKVLDRDRVSEQPAGTAGDAGEALDFERTVPGRRLVQMAESGELKLGRTPLQGGSIVSVSPARTIVRLPTAGR